MGKLPNQKDNNGFSVVELLLILVVVGLISGVAWYVRHASQKATQNYDSVKNQETTSAKKNKSTAKTQSPDTTTETQDVYSGDTWWEYKNTVAGFSLSLPPKMQTGMCKKEGESYYLKDSTAVPLAVIQSGDRYYVTQQYSYQLSGEKKSASGSSMFSVCGKFTSDSAMLARYLSGEMIILDTLPIGIYKVASEADILSQARKALDFQNISLKSVSSVAGKDWKQVTVACNDTTDIGTCPLNYRFDLRYFPAKQRMVLLVQGQSAHIMDPTGEKVYDQQIFDSFKLL